MGDNHCPAPFNLSWQIACNAVVSFRRSASARSFASGACSTKLRSAAKIFPIQRVEPAPWVRPQSSSMAVTQAIFGINVAVFIAMALAGVSMLDNPSGQDLVHWGANFGPLTVGGQWWRLLTCVFVHGGLLHIGFNMWCLWEPRQTRGIGLWPLDICRGLSDLRAGGEPREPDLESRSS